MIKNNTFWNLINNQGIEIPPIQRDYAQGRNTGKIPSIRAKFIDSIFTALERGETLGLDFIYGKIFGLRNEEEFRRNKDAIESLLKSIQSYANTVDLTISNISISEKNNDGGALVYLIPLDGQQRLTTLFLIHWYVFVRLKKTSELRRLLRFRYKTRKSSESFIQILCNVDMIHFEKDLKEQIMGFENFSNTWLEDPTVVSMLNVLDAIHKFCDKRYDEKLYGFIFDNLVNSDRIYFDFLDLKDFNLSDDLYVKMNARGKQLSDFENFKAWLFNKIENDHWIDSKIWPIYSQKFDIEWNDLFWNSKKRGGFDIDKAYLNYFKLSFLSHFISNYDAKEPSTFAMNASEFYKQSEVVEKLISGNDDFDFEKFFDCHEFAGQLAQYFRFLDFCCVEKNGFSNLGSLDELLQDTFNNYHKEQCFSTLYFSDSATNWWQKLYFFAIQRYILKRNKTIGSYTDADKENLKRYNRIISNLIFNAYVDSPDDFKNFLGSIEKLLATLDIDTSIYLQHDLISKTSFVAVQKEDEILKCELIISDAAWEDSILKAEKHPYFYGQIKFLIDLAANDLKRFNVLYDKISVLFTSEILNSEEYLLQRAMLTIGNYFVVKSNKFSFCKNSFGTVRERNENWRQIFNKTTTRNNLRMLVEDPLYDVADVRKSLNQIIKVYQLSDPIEGTEIKDIHYCNLYIHNADLFKYGSSNLIQLHKNKFAYQLNSTMTVGYFNELITAYIKGRHYAGNDRVKYKYVKGWDKFPSITIDEKVSIRLDPEEEILIFDNNPNATEAKTIHEALTEINKLLV